MDCPPEFQTRECLPEAVLRHWLKACGKAVRIFKGARIINPERVEFGDHSLVDEGAYLFAGQGIRIGRHVHLAFNSSIYGGGTCELGDFVGIGVGARLVTGTDLPDRGLTNPTIPPEHRAVSRQRVEVRPYAVVFTNSVVFPGVTIGEGAVVSAGSVVHKDLRPWTVYGGNPLVPIGVRSRDLIIEQTERLARRLAGTQNLRD